MNSVELILSVKDETGKSLLAENGFSAAAIANSLHLSDLPDDASRLARVMLYRRHAPLGSSRTKLKRADAFREAIAGREPLVLELSDKGTVSPESETK